jgi:nitroreductase
MPPDTNILPEQAHGDSSLLLRQRYGATDAPSGLHWNEVITSLPAHRSVRAYLPQPLPKGALETAIAAAQSAASSSNLQVWSVVAVEEPARKARLAAFAGDQKQIAQAPLFLVWLADLSRLKRLAEARGIETAGLSYLELLVVGIVDTALAAQNAVAAFESQGLGTVYIGALRNNPGPVAAELGLPPHVFPVFGLTVGHPDPTRPAAIKPRLAQAAVLSRETYSTAGEVEAVARYDSALEAFQQEQGQAVEGWSARAIERIRTPQALHGRHHLRQALHDRGFDLI